VLQRTLVNTSPGGSFVKMADPEAGGCVWDLSFTGLTDAEIAAFESLFQACEGRLRDFLFLDPLGNLLNWTEDLSKSVWQTGMQVVGGQEDPAGGTAAARVTNAAQGCAEHHADCGCAGDLSLYVQRLGPVAISR
jgi:hypothetical protein